MSDLTLLCGIACLVLGTACNNADCRRSASQRTVPLAVDAGWSAASVHTGADCAPKCPQNSVCVQYDWSTCTVSADAGQLDCIGDVAFCSGDSSCTP